MKKLIYLVAAAFAICAGVSFTSCDKESRTEIIGNLIDNGLDYLTRDSTTWLSGTWAYAEEGYIDTLWIGKDSVFSSHTFMIDEGDTIDLYRTGGYLYYMSFGQTLVQYNFAYNFQTKKELSWEETIIYGTSRTKLNVAEGYGINTLTLEELDAKTGESLGTTTYTYVSDNTLSPYAQ